MFNNAGFGGVSGSIRDHRHLRDLRVSTRNRSGEDRPSMDLGAKAFTPRSKRGG